jgi:hypothetical protein
MESMSLTHAIDRLLQAQLAMFEAICTDAGVAADDQARVLGLPPNEWRSWRQFRAGAGPRPTTPAAGDLLLRIGSVSFELAAREPRTALA